MTTAEKTYPHLVRQDAASRRYERADGTFFEVRAQLRLFANEVTSTALTTVAELRDLVQAQVLQEHAAWAATVETFGEIDARWETTHIEWVPGEVDEDGEPVEEFEPYDVESYWVEQAWWPAPEVGP